MTSKFGRGGNTSPNKDYENPFSAPTEPAPLDFGTSKAPSPSVTPTKSSSYPSGRGYGGGNDYGGGYGGGYGGSSGRGSRESRSDNYSRHREDPERDFSDLSTVDGLQDQELKDIRKENMRLANEERYHDIRHTNDLASIVKYVLVTFAVIVGIAFIIGIGALVYISVKSGTFAAPGLFGDILNFIIDLVKISMS